MKYTENDHSLTQLLNSTPIEFSLLRFDWTFTHSYMYIRLFQSTKVKSFSRSMAALSRSNDSASFNAPGRHCILYFYPLTPKIIHPQKKKFTRSWRGNRKAISRERDFVEGFPFHFLRRYFPFLVLCFRLKRGELILHRGERTLSAGDIKSPRLTF